MFGPQIMRFRVCSTVAVQDSLYTAGRRGVGVTVLLEKIAGAAAEEGRRPGSSGRHRAQGQRTGSRSMGVALSSCTVPAAGKPTFELGDDEMELGIGIHGEPGAGDSRWLRPGTSPPCWSTRYWPTCPSRSGDSVLAFVNGMGGSPLIELYVMYNEVAQLLGKAGITVVRSLVGNVHHLGWRWLAAGHYHRVLAGRTIRARDASGMIPRHAERDTCPDAGMPGLLRLLARGKLSRRRRRRRRSGSAAPA